MAPTKTRPLLWLLPALAAAQSSCHKSRKGVRCNNRTGRDRRCWADEKCGRGATQPVVPTFAALDRCRRPRCAVCGSGAPPVLYGEFHADGVGVTLGNALRMAELAYRNNYSFGGVLRLPDKRNANGHGTMDWRVLDALFGATSVYANPRLVAGLAPVDPCLLPRLRGRPKVYMKRKSSCFGHRSTEFLTLFRAGARCYLDAYAPRLAFDPRALRVAIHLRRGDVDGSFRRFVHDENVTRALDWIGDVARSVAPALAVDVHIFTSTIADERRYRTVHGERRFWTSADFDVFRRRGVSVHIDVEGRGGPAKHPALTTDAALLHMAHWSTADVFLAGHSSFSSIPALLNPNCVMAPMYTPNSAKRACVARLARARAAELSRA